MPFNYILKKCYVLKKCYILKKCPVIMLALICAWVGADGQDVLFALKGGLNFSTFRGNNLGAGVSSRTAFNVGDIVEIGLSKNFSFQAETEYSAQGATLTSGVNTTAVKLNYFVAPVLLKYMHRSGLFVETGPQPGFLLSARDKSGSMTTSSSGSFQSFDFAWVFGAGCYLTSRLGIDIRYNEGLINITGAAILTGYQTTKSSVYAADIFFELGKGKRIRSKF